MKLPELKAALEAERIDPQAYQLNGYDQLPSDTYVIWFSQSGFVGRNGCWEVYYSERGRKNSLRQFETEEEACNYFLSWILRDSSLNLK